MKKSHLNLFVFPHREKGVPILSLSDQKDIALEIKVVNQGEDAYEAQLSSSFPKSLSYSAVRTKSGVSSAARCLTYDQLIYCSLFLLSLIFLVRICFEVLLNLYRINQSSV